MDKKDFNKIRKNFLFFGSGGTLHKGLDIVINIFKKRTDLNLTICGNYDYEPNFKNYYSNVFENKFSNIKFAGFVNIESDEFKNIMDNNAAVIFPSLSEGGAVAILNVMANGGLIPIISESSGLDVGHYGFMFQEISEKNVEQYIDKFLQLDIDKLRELSTSVKNETRHLYSYDKYKTNLAQIINNELKEGFGVDNTHGNMPDTVVASE